jgi:hypothetical protein
LLDEEKQPVFPHHIPVPEVYSGQIPLDACAKLDGVYGLGIAAKFEVIDDVLSHGLDDYDLRRGRYKCLLSFFAACREKESKAKNSQRREVAQPPQ